VTASSSGPARPGGQRLAGHGLTATLAAPWEGRIYRRDTPTTPFIAQNSPQRVPGRAQYGGAGWAGEVPHPVMHLANFPLPADRGDYGTGAVELMTADSVFVALLEFGPENLGTALFAPQGIPVPSVADFDANALQKRLAGQGGFQRFCTVANRALAVYVVIGSLRRAAALQPQVAEVIGGIEVQPA
jgi:hypothetical protein